MLSERKPAPLPALLFLSLQKRLMLRLPPIHRADFTLKTQIFMAYKLLWFGCKSSLQTCFQQDTRETKYALLFLTALSVTVIIYRDQENPQTFSSIKIPSLICVGNFPIGHKNSKEHGSQFDHNYCCAPFIDSSVVLC